MRSFAVALLLLAPAVASGATEDPYVSRLAEADRLAAEGRYEESARVAADLARDYPEDPAAHVRHGYALYRAGRIAQAREAYRAAYALSPTNRDAIEGLALVGKPWFVTPGAYVIGQYHAAHPYRRWAAGTVASVEAGAADHLRLAAVYRFLHVGGTDGRRNDLDQHEAWAWVGWEDRRFGLSAFGTYLHWAPSRAPKGTGQSAQAPRWSPDAGAAGGVVRVTVFADLIASLAHSFYDDYGVTQATLDAWVPVVRFLAVRAGAEVQVADGAVTPSGIATLRFHGATWSLDIEGRFGQRRRPLDLRESSMYNLQEDRLDFGARVAARFPIAGPVSGHAAYDLEGLRTPAAPPTGSSGGVPETVSTAHRLTVGATVSF